MIAKVHVAECYIGLCDVDGWEACDHKTGWRGACDCACLIL